jgi:hypothetical protein
MSKTMKSATLSSASEGMIGSAMDNILPRSESGRIISRSGVNQNDVLLGQPDAKKHRSNPVPLAAPAGQEYVDPFLFETGHFESREEYEAVSRKAKIRSRARA